MTSPALRNRAALSRSVFFALSIVVTMTVLPAASAAQSCGGGGSSPLGDILLSFDPESYDRYLGTASAPNGDPTDTTIPVFTPFTFYLILDIDFCDCGDCGLNGTNGARAWEAQLDLSQAPGLTIIGTAFDPPQSVNVGIPASTNFRVSANGCIVAGNSPNVAITFTGVFLDENDLTDQRIGLRSATPPGQFSPGWSRCDNLSVKFPFRSSTHGPRPGYEEGFVVVNPSTSLEPRDEVDVIVGDSFIEEGEIGFVPIVVSEAAFPKADISTVAGLEFRISWSPNVATLMDVHLTDATADWLVEANIESGTAMVAMATADDVVDAAFRASEVLSLEFLGVPLRRTSVIAISEAQVFDAARDPLPIVPKSGILEVGCDEAEVVLDGEINSADASRTLQFAVDLRTPTAQEACAADIDGDEDIDTGDGVLILRRAVGLNGSQETGASTASLSLRPGINVGELIVEARDVAGLEGTLRYDPDTLDFRTATALGSSGMLTVNPTSPGSILFSVARTEVGDVLLQVDFEVKKPGALVSVLAPAGFDTAGRDVFVDVIQGQAGVDVTTVGTELPLARPRLQILGTSPNPFNPAAKISFRLTQGSAVRMSVLDSAGRVVWRHRQAWARAGLHETVWNGLDINQRPIASGTYTIVLEAGGDTDATRVSLIK